MPQMTSKKSGIAETNVATITDCYTCTISGAWEHSGCPACPSYQKKHYTVSKGGLPANTDYFCVGESPFLSGFTEKENHSGWSFDIERTIFIAFQSALIRLGQLEGRFTYAVRCQIEKPNAKEMVACAPNLRAELLEYATPEKPICIFAMGATALKSLGIQFGKYTDVIGKIIETNIDGRQVYVFVSLSKRQLATKAGYSEILSRQIDVFLKMAHDNRVGELEAKRSVLSRLSEGYQYPRTVKELSDLVTEIIDYSIPGIDKKYSPISLDTETNTLYPHRDKLQLLMISVCWDKGKAAAIQLEHPDSEIDLEDARPHLERLFSCVKPKIFANAKYDLKVFKQKGFEIEQLSWDVMLGEHLIEEDKKGFYGLKHITRLRLPEFSAYEDELKEIYAGRLDNDTLIPADNAEASYEEQLLKKVKPTRGRKKKKAEEGPKKSRLEKKLEADDGYKSIPLHELMKYAAFDADVTFRCAAQQRTELTEESKALAKKRAFYGQGTKETSKQIGEVLFKHPNPPLYNMAKRILPTTKVLSKMELHGMAVDREYILKLQADMDSYLASASSIFADMLPIGLTDFNPASTQHVAKALFSTGYLQPGTGELICYAGKIEPPRTEKGAISTDAKFLKFLTNTHKCALSAALLEFRGISKARSTFIENIEVLSREDGRMHSNFHQHGTATARLCVSENTVLNTSKGKIRISNLKLDDQSPTYIRTHTGKMQRILGVYYKGKEMMYRVRKENGDSIETTLQHRFLTPSGFKPLQGLSCSDEITAYYSSPRKVSHWNSFKRRRFCRLIPTSKTNQRTAYSSEYFTQDNYQFNSVLQGQIRGGDPGTKTLSILTGFKRKHARTERFSWRNSSTRNTDSLLRTGIQLGNDSQKTRSERLVRTSEYEIPWGTAYRKNSLPVNEFRHGYLDDAGTICSRDSKSSNTLLRESTTLFRTSVYRAFTTSRAELVRKRTIPGISGMGGTRKNSKESYLLEFKPLRITPVKSPSRQQYTAYTTSNSFQELPSRLWIPVQETTRGNKWRIPLTGRNKKARCCKKTIHRKSRIHNPYIYNTRNTKRPAYRYRENSFRSERITHIEPIGVMGVWDIQVETDHSYVAHGFVNHNSSSEENMQNIPKRIGKPPHQYHIKRIFIPTRPDFIIVNADAKAAEVRVYAAYSRDKALIAALNNGMDPHSFFAATVYNVQNVLQGIKPAQYASVLATIGIDQEHAWSYEDFEARDTLKKLDKAYGEQLDALRKNIKRVVFGILYGAAPRKISGIVGIPEDQAEAIIRTLFNMFPSIKDYIDITKKQVQHLGLVETFLGRRRHLNLQNLPRFLRSRAERQAVNFKIQNTSAEMVLDVLCTTDPVIESDFGGNMLNTVHDSLVFQIPKKYAYQMPAFIQDYGVKQVAQKYPWLPVPFSWDVEVGANYGDLMPVSTFLSNNPELVTGEEDDYMDLEIRNALAEEATAEHNAA